jgi:hypothetical protein
MNPTEILDKVIFSPRHDGQLPAIRRLWLEHLAEINKVPEKDYTIYAMLSILAAWIVSVSIYLNFAG